jgi:hypothetical protein
MVDSSTPKISIYCHAQISRQETCCLANRSTARKNVAPREAAKITRQVFFRDGLFLCVLRVFVVRPASVLFFVIRSKSAP